MKYGKFIFGALLILCSCAVKGTVENVIKEPTQYRGSHLSLVGIARVPGPFYLFSDIAAARKRNASKAILVIHSEPPWRTFDMDRKWVRVTGVVNPVPHVPGQSPCVLAAEGVEVISKEPDPRIKDSIIYGTFLNTLSFDVQVELSSRPVSTTFFIGAHTFEKYIEVTKGSLKVFTLNGPETIPSWKRTKGELIAHGDLTIPKLSPKYVYSAADSDERTAYYRISRGNVELISPSKAKEWIKKHR